MPLPPVDIANATPVPVSLGSDQPSILTAKDPKIKNFIPERPTEPTVFNTSLNSSPIFEFSEVDFERLYPQERNEDGTVKEPIKPVDFSDPYLFPTLTRNELIRLKSLWYYGRYIDQDKYLLSCLQDQVDLVNDFMQKDCVILGLLDHDYYRRIVTAGIPLAILPRREATCAHTILHRGGKVFMVKDMQEDWRFISSPHVEAGLKFYAGTQLRYKVPSMDAEIAFGSLCVANFSSTDPLTARQQSALIKFADIIVHTIIERNRGMRLAERERLTSVLAQLTKIAGACTIQQTVLSALNETYPFATSSCQIQPDALISLSNRASVPYNDFRDHMWEDNNVVKNWISNHNHTPYIPDESDTAVRAIAVRGKFVPTAYLVVETTDMKQIFDEVDTWFVKACANLICNTMQEDMLRRTTEAKSRFLRGVSHELRTPIHAILSSCELLIEESKDGGPIASSTERMNGLSPTSYFSLSAKSLQMLSNIDSSGRELLSTVNNLLDYDQFENKATVQVMQLHSLNIIEEEVLREATSAFAIDRGVSLISDNQLPPEVELIMTDFSLLKQCLGQLVRNAMRFTNSGTVIFQTALSAQHEIIEYNIVDTGIGIEKKDFERIFLPFEKGDAPGQGAGLGLTVATKIAEVLGGSVNLVSSVVGRGSHFQLQLKNPILACPINSYRKRILLNCEMPLTYFMPIERQLETVHLTYAARNLERMGFIASSPENAIVVLVEAKSMVHTFQDLLSSVRKDQIIVYLCQNYSELRESEEALHNDDYSRRLVRCLTPVRRGRLWQVVEDVTKAYYDLRLKYRHLNIIAPSLRSSPKLQATHLEAVSRENSLLRQRIHDKRPFDALRILIVDDNPTNMGILAMYCVKRKFDYITAVNGQDALEKYKQAASEERYVSLVLMDLDMPVRNGVDSTRDIRMTEAQEGLQPSMIFMVTGQNADEDKRRAVEAGANGYYVKPLSMRTLDNLIQLHFPKN
ncbi:hypothetical protein ABW19_dt0200715 [Dactylella cylindrospora]|nr:hypothetical protein ABW19_dt0200715 [Dactylella cylindrospora]